MSEQQRRVQYEITFTPRIKINTKEFASATLLLGVVSFIFLLMSFFTSKCFTQYTDTALVTGLASVPFIAMALVFVGFVKLLTIKDGKPSCRLPWWPECLIPRDVKVIESEDERTPSILFPWTQHIDIIGRIEFSMTSHLARFRNILPTDRTSADFDDIPTDSSHRRRQKLSEVESAEEPSSQDIVSSDEVFLPAEDGRESEDSITSGPAGGDKRQQPDEGLDKSLLETRVAYKKGDKGGEKPSPEAISILEPRVDRKRDSSAISALEADESNKRSKPDKQFGDNRHPLEPRIIIRGSESDVTEPPPVSFDRRTKPDTAYVISVHIPRTDSECSSSFVIPAVAVGDEHDDLERYGSDGRKSEPDARHDSSADVVTTDPTELPSSSQIREVEDCGERPATEQSVGVYGELKPDTRRGRSENVTAADVELLSSCNIAEAVVEQAGPEQMPRCSDRVKDGPDSPVEGEISPYSVVTLMDLKLLSILSISAPAIPAAVQKHEREGSKRTISECRLTNIGMRDAEDASAKETRASEESQKVESGLETTDSGETRASGSLSVECIQSSVDSGVVGVRSGTPLSSEESDEPAENANKDENIE